MPEISIDLVVRNDQVSFRPELENAKARFYKEVRKFAQIPFSFRGLGDERELFNQIGSENAHLLHPTVKKGEEIFAQVWAHKENYSDWVLPLQVDCDKIFMELTSTREFEDALRSVKKRGKDLERLTPEIRVGCVVLSLSTFKRQIEALLQKVYSGLCTAMQTKAINISKEVGKFVSESRSQLESRVTSFEDISKQQVKHAEIVQKMKKTVSVQYSTITDLLQLIQRTTGETIDVGQLKSDWEGMSILLQSYEENREEQLEQIKEATLEQKRSLISKIDILRSKWNSGKPDPTERMTDTVKTKRIADFINEKMEDVNDLEREIFEVTGKLELFEMDSFDSEIFESLKSEVKDNFDNWALLSNFEEIFSLFLTGEWSGMKSRVHEFHDKGTDWAKNNLIAPESGSLSLMQTRIKNRLDAYMAAVPFLKYCQGDNFTTDHWLDLFRLLEIPKGTTVDKLKMGDLLERTDEIQANLDKIKAINDRAHVEISIRESLRDIELWAGQLEFEFKESTDSLGTD